MRTYLSMSRHPVKTRGVTIPFMSVCLAMDEVNQHDASLLHELGWKQKWSTRKDRCYYVNRTTHERVWSLPEDVTIQLRQRRQLLSEPHAAVAGPHADACHMDEELEEERHQEHDEEQEHDQEIVTRTGADAEAVSSLNGLLHRPTMEDINSAVAAHYDLVCGDHSVKLAKQQSLERARCLNNWVKQSLVEAVVQALCRVHPARNAPINILDLAAGKGGDIGKLARAAESAGASIGLYASVDASPASVLECAHRAEKLLRRGTQHVHAVCNIGSYCPYESIREQMRTACGRELDKGTMRLVWCAFAAHYFFRSETHLVQAVRATAKSLCMGGLFAATFVDGNVVLKLARDAACARAESIPEAATLPLDELKARNIPDPTFTFESEHWRIEMPWRTLVAANTEINPYALRYRFWMPARCDDPAEYFVNGDLVEEFMPVDELFIKTCASYGLRLVFECKNSNIIRHNASSTRGKQHMDAMFHKLGRLQGVHHSKKHYVHQYVTQADLEVAALYKTMVFASTFAGNMNPAVVQTMQQGRANPVEQAANAAASPVDALGIAIAYELNMPDSVALPYHVFNRQIPEPHQVNVSRTAPPRPGHTDSLRHHSARPTVPQTVHTTKPTVAVTASLSTQRSSALKFINN